MAIELADVLVEVEVVDREGPCHVRSLELSHKEFGKARASDRTPETAKPATGAGFVLLAEREGFVQSEATHH